MTLWRESKWNELIDKFNSSCVEGDWKFLYLSNDQGDIHGRLQIQHKGNDISGVMVSHRTDGYVIHLSSDVRVGPYSAYSMRFQFSNAQDMLEFGRTFSMICVLRSGEIEAFPERKAYESFLKYLNKNKCRSNVQKFSSFKSTLGGISWFDGYGELFIKACLSGEKVAEFQEVQDLKRVYDKMIRLGIPKERILQHIELFDIESVHKVLVYLMELEKTTTQIWIRGRVNNVLSRYSVYDCLHENGHGEMLVDEETSVQIRCPDPNHGVDNRPSSRYYPRSGGRPAYVRCFKCKESWNGLNLFAKFQNLRFMDALSALEKRYHIRVERKPDAPAFKELLDKDSNYQSEKWADVPYVLNLLEVKLSRVKSKCSMLDYIKFCRVLDNVLYDYDKLEKSTPDMISVLLKLRNLMDEASTITDDLFMLNQDETVSE